MLTWPSNIQKFVKAAKTKNPVTVYPETNVISQLRKKDKTSYLRRNTVTQKR